MLEQRVEVLTRFKVLGPLSDTGWDEMLVVKLLDGSMMPEFLPGDLLIFTTDLERQELGGYFLHMLNDGKGACFVQELAGGRWIFLDKKYGEYHEPEDDPGSRKLFEGCEVYALVGRIPVGSKGTVLTSGPMAQWIEECAAAEARQPAGD